jgi:hypothetical protein
MAFRRTHHEGAQLQAVMPDAIALQSGASKLQDAYLEQTHLQAAMPDAIALQPALQRTKQAHIMAAVRILVVKAVRIPGVLRLR